MNKSTEVNDYLADFDHPLKAEIETIREIILSASDKITESVKWSAPSYAYKDNLFRINYTGELPSELDGQFKIIGQEAGSVSVQLEAGQDSNTLIRHVLDKGVQVQSFNEILPSLNEIFIKKVNV